MTRKQRKIAKKASRFDEMDLRNYPMTVGKWIGTYIVLAIPLINIIAIICWFFGVGNKSRSAWIRSFVVGCILGIICILALTRVKERVFITKQENSNEKIGAIKGLRLVLKNKPLMILTVALTLGCMKGTIDMIWHIIARVKYATDMATGAKIFGTVSIVVGFAATPNMLFLPLYTRKMNNRTIMIMWQAFNTGAYLILALIGFQNLQPGTTSAIIITALRFVPGWITTGCAGLPGRCIL